MTTPRVRRLGYLTMALLNLAVLAAGLMGIALWRREQAVRFPSRLEGTITAGFFEPAADVGYIPYANQTVTARRVTDTGVIYDVTYTIGSDHFRIMPPPGPPSAAQPTVCAALFGDSFTFGEGVNDDQTYPWQLVAGSGGRIQAFNFGIGGWGPHQMLAGLDSGRFQAAMTCQPTVAVYTMNGGHLRRLSGRDDWVKGPRYRLDAGGRAVRDGNLRASDQPFPDALDEGFLSWRRLLGTRRSGTPEDIALAAAMFAQSRQRLNLLPLKPPLHVIYWDVAADTRNQALLDRLAADGVVIHRIETIIPGVRDTHLDYEISPIDAHPNARAHRLVATYVADRIMGVRLGFPTP